MLIVTDLYNNSLPLLDYDRLERKIGTNGDNEVTLTIRRSERNAKAFDLIETESILTFQENSYRIKVLDKNTTVDGVVKIEAIAWHVFYDSIDNFQHKIIKGETVLTLHRAISHALQGTSITFQIDDKFDSVSFENFGDDNSIALFDELKTKFGFEFSIMHEHLTIVKQLGKTENKQMRYKHNIKAITMEDNTHELSTYIKGYGKPVEDEDGSPIEGEYIVADEYTSPNIEKYGMREATPYFNEKITHHPTLRRYLMDKIQDEPVLTFSIEYAELARNLDFDLDETCVGDAIFLIHEPMNLQFQIRVAEVIDHPLSPHIKPTYIMSTKPIDLIGDDKVALGIISKNNSDKEITGLHAAQSESNKRIEKNIEAVAQIKNAMIVVDNELERLEIETKQEIKQAIKDTEIPFQVDQPHPIPNSKLWWDSSVNPSRLMRWDGTAWIVLASTKEEIDIMLDDILAEVELTIESAMIELEKELKRLDEETTKEVEQAIKDTEIPKKETAPEEIPKSELWWDSSIIPPRLKRWNGEEWVVLANTEDEIDNLVRTSRDEAVTTVKEYTNKEIIAARKAIQDEISQNIGNVQGSIDSLKDLSTSLKNQADKIDKNLTSLETTIASDKLEIENEMANKIGDTEYRETIGSLEENITGIKSSYLDVKAEVDINTGKVTKVEQDVTDFNIRATGIEASVSKVKDDVSGISEDVTKVVIEAGRVASEVTANKKEADGKINNNASRITQTAGQIRAELKSFETEYAGDKADIVASIEKNKSDITATSKQIALRVTKEEYEEGLESSSANILTSMDEHWFFGEYDSDLNKINQDKNNVITLDVDSETSTVKPYSNYTFSSEQLMMLAQLGLAYTISIKEYVFDMTTTHPSLNTIINKKAYHVPTTFKTGKPMLEGLDLGILSITIESTLPIDKRTIPSLLLMLNKGNRAQPYQPRTEDTAERISKTEASISVNAEAIKLKASQSSVNKKVETSIYNKKMGALDVSINGITGIVEDNTTAINNATGELELAKTDLSSMKQDASGFKRDISSLKANETTANKRFASIEEKAGEITQTVGKVSTSLKDKTTIHDTRNDNQLPKYYYDKYARETVYEFKYADVIGLSKGKSYGVLTTVIPWSGTSGGAIKQTFVIDDTEYKRSGTTSWSKWITVENTSGAQSKANTAASSAVKPVNDRLVTAETKIKQLPDSISLSVREEMSTRYGNLVKNPELTGNHQGWSGGAVTSYLDTFEGTPSTRVLRNTATTNAITYSEWFEVDPAKAYEVSMWIRKNAARGIDYLGLHGNNSDSGSANNVAFESVTSSSGVSSDSTNFYFHSASKSNTKWTKLVGYIMPTGTPANDVRGLGTTSRHAIMKPNLKRVRLRWLNYNNGGTATYMYVAMPKVVEINGESVSRTNVLSSINLSKEGVQIQGDKIDIHGLTTFSGITSDKNLLAGLTSSGTAISAAITNGIVDIGSPYTTFGTGTSTDVAIESSYIQYDLGAIYRIQESKAYFYSNTDRYYWYKIKYSKNGTDWYYAVGNKSSNGWKKTIPLTQSGNTKVNPTVDTFAFPLEARYVRLYGNGNSSNASNHIYEWELFSTTQTSIHGGSIKTNTITTNEISVNNIFGNSAVIAKIQSDSVKTAILDAGKISAGTLNAGLVNVINLSASKITTGTLNATNVNITNLNATNIATGTLNAARIGAKSITVAKLDVTEIFGNSAVIAKIQADSVKTATLSASKVTTGILNATNVSIINLSASIIKTGTLDAKLVNIANLNASNINSGTLNAISIVGSTITGSTINVTTNLTVGNNIYVGAQDSKLWKYVRFNSTNTISSNGDYTDIKAIRLRTNSTVLTEFSNFNAIRLRLVSNFVEIAPKTILRVNDGVIQGKGVNRLNINSDHISNLSTYNRTYTSSTQMMRVTVNGVFGRSTSSRRYKLQEKEVGLEYAKRMLNVKAKSWYDKSACEDYAHTLETGEETEGETISRVIGTIAEDTHDAGLELLVNYNEEGKPEGVASNGWVLHTPLIQDLYDENKALKKRLDKLEQLLAS